MYSASSEDECETQPLRRRGQEERAGTGTSRRTSSLSSPSKRRGKGASRSQSAEKVRGVSVADSVGEFWHPVYSVLRSRSRDILAEAGLKVRLRLHLRWNRRNSEWYSYSSFQPVLWIQIHWIWIPDPDLGVWPNLEPDPDPGLYNQFWKKKFKIILEKNNFL